MQSKTRLALFLSAALAAGAAFAADKPVAVVNGVAIPATKMDFILKSLAERGAKDSPELRQKIRDDLVTKEIIAQEAAKQGLEKQADVAMEMEMAKQGVLLNSYVANFVKSVQVSEAQIKSEYEKQVVANAPKGKEYRARHILVKTEAEAKTILADLKKGKSFEELAKAKSEDPGSKVNGGDLGWASPDNFVKEFGEAMQKLEKGKITSAPVKTQFGFHIIKLDDLRDAKPRPLDDEIKAALTQQIQRMALDKMIGDLKAKAKVE